MHDLFYSEEQYREYQDELLGDGFTNEYQRCFFQSQLERPLKDERVEATRLHDAGRFVVCGEWDVCCPVTDGLIGYDWVVLRDFATLDEAQAYIGEAEDRVDGVFLYQPPAERLRESLPVKEFDDDLPF